MIDAPLTLAFTAGLVATVNPCGFAMLPAYLSYFLGLEDDTVREGRASTVVRGLVIGGVVSTGFLGVFAVVGLLVTVGLQQVVGLVPWITIAIGIALAGLGIAMLAGYEPVTELPKLRGRTPNRRFSGVFLFGVSYAVASLSCTLPIFLTVVAGAIPRANLVSGIVTFLVYGIGMALVLVAVTLALAVGKRAFVGALRRGARHVGRISGAILVLAGVYLVYFWATNLTSSPGRPSDPVVLVENVSGYLNRAIGARPLVWGAALAAVVAVGSVYVLVQRRSAG